jgi:hypothetical protein
MQKTLLLSLFWICSFSIFAQNRLQSPREFLGYELGKDNTPYHQVIAYLNHVAQNTTKVKLTPYGKTYENRPLVTTFISTPENLQNLEQIRQNNLINTGLAQGSKSGKELPIVWLSYTVHGNEVAGTEAALGVLYELVTSPDSKIQSWLQNLVIVLDPCENPDGRERYIHWYQTVKNTQQDVTTDSWEHREPWAKGRWNHYLFDMNRDWAWQTQVETQQRTAFYQQWMPHVHIDLHEMGYEQSYFFGPAAKPYHESISEWQRKFQELMAKNHAKYFDKNFELYFTKEVYDLYAPSYGDTWPSFNGAVGLTYEQGGIGGGLGVLRSSGDTLFFTERVRNHYVTSLSTIESTYMHREQMLKEFEKYFAEGKNNPTGTHKSYVIKKTNSAGKVEALLSLLDRQQIRYGYPKGGGGKSGFAYQKGKDESFTLESEDIIISAYQPKSRLVKVLFEPTSGLEDSLTYDITAWAMPYIYGLEAYAVKENIGVSDKKVEIKFTQNILPDSLPYAYLATWRDFKDVQVLAQLLQQGIRIRYSELPFEIGKDKYERGTLIITRADNEKTAKDFDEIVLKTANQFRKMLKPVFTGLVNDGKDLGSEYVNFIQTPKVAIVAGDNTVATEFGAVWHHFEQELGYPVTVIRTDYLNQVNLSNYQAIVLPAGNMSNYTDKLLQYVAEGGKVIVLDNSIEAFSKKSHALSGGLQKMEEENKKKSTSDNPKDLNLLKKYESRERSQLEETTGGAIYKIHLDSTHPLAFGEDETYHLLRQNTENFPFMPAGSWNVGVFKKDSYVSGFVGAKLKEKIPNTLALGIEPHGKGKIIYFTESPLFRGFWYAGKLLFGNALFLVR